MKQSIKTRVSYITVEADFENQRIDNFLFAQFKNIPKTHFYRILRKGEIRVNKKRIQPSYKLKTGDQIRIPPLHYSEEKITLSPPKELQALLMDRIIYEDNLLIILNKPAGIAVHGGKEIKWGIIDIMRLNFPQFPHLELAHRLDVDTTGCLILAKKKSILRELHELLRSNQVIKEYWALTKGHWLVSELDVTAPLQKNILSSGERIVKVSAEGKSAKSVFTLVQEFSDASLMKVRLHTGRTHQIRVHASYQGHPIAGDEKYGDREFNKSMREKGLKRIFLHAQAIEFKLISTGQLIQVQAPLDKNMQSFLDKMSKN